MRRAFAILVLLASAQWAYADPVVGTWASPPDNKGQTGHVVMRSCGDALCGTLERAFDTSGKEITTANVGKRLLWDIRPQGSGTYVGRAYVPLFGRDFPAEVTLVGNRLVVKGCAAGLACKSQNWTRVN